MVAVDSIRPCPLQPRVNVSVDLVRRLAESMRAGRHEPLLEVEPAPQHPGHYQIVCGEQRWRAAREAGLRRVLVRIHPRLGYLERLQKQYEENCLRADLDPVEDARAVLVAKILRDVQRAEQLLHKASIPFQPLEEKRVTDRADFDRHLERLKTLLIEHKVHVKQADGKVVCGPLSPWSETERALRISEAARKAKLAILRLEPALLEEVHRLPAHHSTLVARVGDRERRAQLVAVAARLTHRRLQAVVSRLRENPELTVQEAMAERFRMDARTGAGPLAFEVQLRNLADLCRQLSRTLANLRTRLSPIERMHVVQLLVGLRQTLVSFEEAL